MPDHVSKVIIYACQIIAIFIVIVACVVNLSLGNDKAELWSSLLSGSLGYLLPAPKLRKNESFLSYAPEQQLQGLLSGQHLNSIQDTSLVSDIVDGGVGGCANGDNVSQSVAHDN